MGLDYAFIGLQSFDNTVQLIYVECLKADSGAKEKLNELNAAAPQEVWLRVKVEPGGICSFSYSIDGKKFMSIDKKFKASPGKWIGAKVGVFATGQGVTNDAGYADFDWVRLTK